MKHVAKSWRDVLVT